MNNRVPEVFLSEMFGELRIMKDDNKFYFCAADVCSALGYSNPSHELNIHCRHDGIKAGRTNLNAITTFTLYLNRMQRCRKQNAGGALMFKVLGGIGRSVPLYNGKARILVKAIIPAAPKCLAEMQSICEANGWKSVLDERGNLVVLSVVSIDAYRLSDSTLMNAYLRFAETAAQKLTGNKNRYLVAGVVSYDAAA
jgi:hypothetical protein